MNVNQSRGRVVEAVTADLNRQYGSIIANLAASPTLAVKDRELATIAALDAGVTRQEIVDGLATCLRHPAPPKARLGTAIRHREYRHDDGKANAIPDRRTAGEAESNPATGWSYEWFLVLRRLRHLIRRAG